MVKVGLLPFGRPFLRSTNLPTTSDSFQRGDFLRVALWGIDTQKVPKGLS
jgi:hypothetical protein